MCKRLSPPPRSGRPASPLCRARGRARGEWATAARCVQRRRARKPGCGLISSGNSGSCSAPNPSILHVSSYPSTRIHFLALRVGSNARARWRQGGGGSSADGLLAWRHQRCPRGGRRRAGRCYPFTLLAFLLPLYVPLPCSSVVATCTMRCRALPSAAVLLVAVAFVAWPRSTVCLSVAAACTSAHVIGSLSPPPPSLPLPPPQPPLLPPVPVCRILLPTADGVGVACVRR